MNEIEEDEIDIRELFITIRENIWTIVIITIISILIASSYIYWTRAIYSADVTIALEGDKKSSKLGDILSIETVIGNTLNSEDKLQLAKITLMSKKFIGTIIDKLDVSREFFIKKNFRKIELDNFSNLKIDIKYKNSSLYGEDFEIIPITEQSFILKVNAIKYKAINKYSQKIDTPDFTIRIIKTNGIDPYDTFAKEHNSTINNFISNLKLEDKTYIFRTFDRDTQIDMIINKMSVSDLKSNSILKLVYQNTLPNRTQKIATEIATNFIDYNLKNKTAELEQTLGFLNSQIRDIKRSLKQQGEKLKKYQEKSSSVIMSQGADILANMDKKEDLINKVALQIQAVKNFRQSLNHDILNSVLLVSAGINTHSIQPLIDSFIKSEETIRELKLQQNNIDKSITSNPQIASLIQDLKEKKTVLQSLLTDFTSEHPQVIEQRKEVDNMINKIHANIVANLEKFRKNKAVAKSTILSNILMVQNNLTNRLRLLRSDIREKKTLLQSMPSKTLKNENLKRGFNLNEKIYTFLLQRKIEIEISKASTIANTKILEDAYIPKKPIKPKTGLILIVSAITGIIIAIFFVFVRSFLDTKIRTIRDIETLTDTAIYGILPKIQNERFFKEALRAIRTNLEFVISKTNCKKILISSTIPTEGKTVISANLSRIIADANRKVLVIDLDLRKARLHQQFNIRNNIGISNYLSNDIELMDLIIPINSYLDFLPAGYTAPNPSELLMSKKFDILVEELEKHYDYIIFDSAPIGIVADTKMILKYSDILLLIVRANISDKIFIRNFNKLKEKYNISSTGIIFNEVKIYKWKSYGYSYGYGYGYEDEFKKDK